MPTKPITLEEAQRVVGAVQGYVDKGHRPSTLDSPMKLAAKDLRLPDTTLRGRLQQAERVHGLTVDYSESRIASAALRHSAAPSVTENVTNDPPPATAIEDEALKILRRGKVALADLAVKLRATHGAALDAVMALQGRGYNIVEFGGAYALEKSMALPASAHHDPDNLPVYYSRPDNTFLFGAVSDNHIGNKHARLDVLNDLYDKFKAKGVDRVFNAGNWIDGVARFNKHELIAHGIEEQLSMLAREYPQRDGIVTYAVAGDDHEGWFAQREGINIGRRAEQTMREAGRDDWVDLGYMESHIKLVNSNTGAWSILAVVHPGGGSAYALSYSIQKIIEALDGGEKPAVALYGHYHKLWAGNIRNVWVIQTGCTEDQTGFMRKNKIAAHVGGVLVGLEQDPATGAIMTCTPTIYRYFNKGYRNGRWGHGVDLVHTPRVTFDPDEVLTGGHQE